MTVFGGYHPLLGHLVMKHGGHKDLIELVSLAKIEREMNVRGKWKIDCLMKDAAGGNIDMHGVNGGGRSNGGGRLSVTSRTDHSVGASERGGEGNGGGALLDYSTLGTW